VSSPPDKNQKAPPPITNKSTTSTPTAIISFLRLPPTVVCSSRAKTSSSSGMPIFCRQNLITVSSNPRATPSLVIAKTDYAFTHQCRPQVERRFCRQGRAHRSRAERETGTAERRWNWRRTSRKVGNVNDLADLLDASTATALLQQNTDN
ncbi:MAG: hypothetical protein ACI82A_001095, partial [Candidatus Azotimanducaceae bacterium]